MKCHKNDNSSDERGCGCSCLGRECGSSIDVSDVEFRPSEANLVYMDKVYSYNKATSCPLMFQLDTGGSNAGRFDVEFNICDSCCGGFPGCGNGYGMDPNATFTVNTVTATLEHISTRPDGNVNASQVTLNGCEVDSLQFSNGIYTAAVAGILPKIQKTRCQDANLPTKSFLLIRNVGPWNVRPSFEIKGCVNSCGRTWPFCAVFTLKDDAADIMIPPTCPSSFAIPDLALPCAVNGIAPDLMFQFGGKIKLVDPEVRIHCGRRPLPGMESEACENGERGGQGGQQTHCSLTLYSKVVLEPSVHAETVRRTLFCTNACEGILPCGPTGTELDIEDRPCTDPYASPCRCGTASAGSEYGCGCGCAQAGCGCEDECTCEEDCGCEDERDCGCEGVCDPCDNGCGCAGSCGCESACDPCVSGCGSRNRQRSRGCRQNQRRPCAGPSTYQYNGCNGCTW